MEKMPESVADRVETKISKNFAIKLRQLKIDMDNLFPNKTDEEKFKEIVSLRKGSLFRDQVIDRTLSDLDNSFMVLNYRLSTLLNCEKLTPHEKNQKRLLGLWSKLIQIESKKPGYHYNLGN